MIAIGIYNAYMLAKVDLNGIVLNSIIAILGTALVGFGWHGVYGKGILVSAKEVVRDTISQPRRDRDFQPRAPIGGRR